MSKKHYIFLFLFFLLAIAALFFFQESEEPIPPDVYEIHHFKGLTGWANNNQLDGEIYANQKGQISIHIFSQHPEPEENLDVNRLIKIVYTLKEANKKSLLIIPGFRPWLESGEDEKGLWIRSHLSQNEAKPMVQKLQTFMESLYAKTQNGLKAKYSSQDELEEDLGKDLVLNLRLLENLTPDNWKIFLEQAK